MWLLRKYLSFFIPQYQFGIVGALAAGAAVVGGVVSAYGAYRANQQNIALSREQMRFQERMSSTAHTREVADLRNAGLNPILSATGGSGASTPTGAKPEIKNALETGVSSALAITRAKAEIKGINANTSLTTAKEGALKPATELGNEAGDLIGGGVRAFKSASQWVGRTAAKAKLAVDAGKRKRLVRARLGKNHPMTSKEKRAFYKNKFNRRTK